MEIKEIYRKRKEALKRGWNLRRLKRERRESAPPYPHCKNCGTELQGMYCHNCGQYAHDTDQNFRTFLIKYLENVYQFDDRLGTTFWGLVSKPGFLTKEFYAGKIASYIHPLTLLMFVTLYFFLAFFFVAQREIPEHLDPSKENYVEFQRTIEWTGASEDEELLARYSGAVKDTVLTIHIDSATVLAHPDVFEFIQVKDPTMTEVRTSSALVEEVQGGNGSELTSVKEFFDNLLALAGKYSPLVALLLTPVLGLLFMAFFRKQKYPYMYHVVFAQHWSSFLFLLAGFILLLDYIIPNSGSVLLWCFAIALVGHTVVACHTLYEGTGWVVASLKSLLILLAYFILLIIVLTILFVLAIYKVSDSL